MQAKYAPGAAHALAAANPATQQATSTGSSAKYDAVFTWVNNTSASGRNRDNGELRCAMAMAQARDRGEGREGVDKGMSR